MCIAKFDENLIKITEYEVVDKLPDPFIFNDGTRVKNVSDWERRRKEIYDTAITLQYGEQPPKPEVFEVEQLKECNPGDHCGYRITAGTKEKQATFTMTVIRPKAEGKLPAVVCGDLCWRYAFDKEYLAEFSDNNVVFVTFNRTELAHDIRGEGRGKGQLYQVYPDLEFGAISAWAWGFSRCVDALETLDFIDMSCIAFTGHSRGAKTAALAGVLDERAVIVNPNETNQGAFSCYRCHCKAIMENGKEFRSERLSDLIKNYGFWMGPKLNEYVDREQDLPFDSHYLKAMVAPRVLLIGDAASDIWTNPIGTWQTSMAATEVYKLYDKPENLLWYWRRGYHMHHHYDVKKLVNVIKYIRGEAELDENFYKTPFKTPELIFDWRCPEK